MIHFIKNIINSGCLLFPIEPLCLNNLDWYHWGYALRETENIKYTDLENIKKEVIEAKKTFKKYKWPLIDVTRKSVEETAASIIKIHEIKNKNV